MRRLSLLSATIIIVFAALILVNSALSIWSQTSIANPSDDFTPAEIQPRPTALTTTYASQLKTTDDFQPVELCITGATSLGDAEIEILHYTDRVNPVGTIVAQPSITVTLHSNRQPVDLIDLYLNTADDGSASGEWIPQAQLGFTAPQEEANFRIGFNLQRKLQGKHLVIVEARYGDHPRSVWQDGSCAQIIYDAASDTFTSGRRQ